MAALEKDRHIWRRDGRILNVPVAADTVIYKGALVCTDSGLAVPASDDSGLRFAGVAMEKANNAGGQDADLSVRVWQAGVFPVFRTGAAMTDVGAEVAAVDDQTVELLSVTTNDVKCGRIVRVLDADEVELKIDGYAY